MLTKAQSSKDKVDVLSQAFIISGQTSAESLNRPFMNSVRMELFFFKEYLITSHRTSHIKIYFGAPQINFPNGGCQERAN